ncbi:CRTAC1 family protein [Parachryseolinea silvisoli]|uniref:CRTAC1 family protein n=1 Tax=Parachryseolinea silvisoli TaxID=2873601 RepID=UPI0022658824|nr:CRTAC1 family protein [Parachryseolinea silvisoli]MCD9014333.1 CRTAC1 family protein [Parachryseolinea silvisoli]
MKTFIPALCRVATLLILLVTACQHKPTCHEEMLAILKKKRTEQFGARNQYIPEAKLEFMDSLLALPHSTPAQIAYCQYLKANILLEIGEEEKAVALFEPLLKDANPYQQDKIRKDLALAYLRLGERSNCIEGHAAASCVLPIRGLGVHRDIAGSRKAIPLYEETLRQHPEDLESRWLLNLAYMTLGEYPQRVPPEFYIPGMEGDTTYRMNAFEDIAGDLNLATRNMAGGGITEDFDNDGYLDLITSGWGLDEEMHYFHNNADGTFADWSDKAGLEGLTGGLNMVQADYNNDGLRDILVLRGAWKGEYGQEPNSLLKNNGDGTFSDVTTQAGLLSFHPTQTATWNDFNNDGWLDLFIGNETDHQGYNVQHPCELYINNQNGTFREVAHLAKVDYRFYVKAVASGDFDNDGLIDLFFSSMDGVRKLLRNTGVQGKEVMFEDVSAKAGFDREHGKTFPTWFFDYDNDGWLDVFVCDYTFSQSLAYYTAAEKLGIPAGSPEKMLLYHNNHDGTFTNVAPAMGLTTNVFAMGSNFGDIDNDGYLDMYLGSGNPNYQSLVPNKMFKNLGGKKFADVTASARVGHLQKGHGVSFADMDNDGDQDIHIEMGGAFIGDAYQNSFFLNPGQGNNHWITILLTGTQANRDAIGSRLKITCTENGVRRTIYRDVNSGGSFGASPLRREIGVGQATTIDELEITWRGSGTVQKFTNLRADQFIRITEGSDKVEPVNLKTITWTLPNRICEPQSLAYNR